MHIYANIMSGLGQVALFLGLLVSSIHISVQSDYPRKDSLARFCMHFVSSILGVCAICVLIFFAIWMNMIRAGV